MAVPFCIGKVIDIIYSPSEQEKMKEKLTTFCQIMVGVFIVGAVANFGRVYLMSVSGNRIINRLRQTLFSSIMRQEMGFFDKTKTGELVNRLSADTTLVGQSVTQNISDGLRAVAQATGGVGMMMYVSPKLTGIALLIVPPVSIMARYYGRFLRAITKDVQDSLANTTQIAEEKISNIRTVRAFGHETTEEDRYNTGIKHVLDLTYKEALMRAMFFGSVGLAGNCVVLSVFYYGGTMMTESQISVGDLSAFLLYAAYIGVSLGGMTSFYSEMMKGLGASTRLWELTDRTLLYQYMVDIIQVVIITGRYHPGGIPGGGGYPGGGLIPTSPVIGNIEFNDVRFIYPSRDDVVIFDKLSLLVPSGSITAVVGPSGSGKSTVGSLLLRYYDPSQGSVTLDGEDIKKIDPTWLRGQIGTVSQEPVLFSCSVRDNIAYGSQDPTTVTDEEIYEAAKKANAYHFINSFPDKFNTLVGERGQTLSGGQRQRVAIARAILKNPKILILDEATSALDAESEYLVHEALERLMVGRTVITIAHRLSTIKSADQIAVIDHGHVSEIGSYSQLMDIPDGLFRKLVERQTITVDVNGS
ncbi:ATP-binding cassette, subfamily B (MDR/TAP), member 10 [Mytilus galloprovincialis]|uniref:ATP-binding cassette sub-family B member 10, mitochondrial n=1 Tax=Mytilus galloprovincialis TaxID=29158 RepID=A0A8B6GCI9_MYTGA|nr:ATP-binding cassette, subfamily B (MDR/TAP), member 10 [Mytilus galloprovincialis]